MQIQPAAPRHLDVIRRLLVTSDLPTEDLTPSHLEHFFVAQGEDDVIGVVGMELYDNVGLLRSLAVGPAHRNGGVGTRLTDAIERHARQEGIRNLYLLTTTASGFFEHRGYQQIERDALPPAIRATDEATRLCPSSAIRMRKRIDVASGEAR